MHRGRSTSGVTTSSTARREHEAAVAQVRQPRERKLPAADPKRGVVGSGRWHSARAVSSVGVPARKIRLQHLQRHGDVPRRWGVEADADVVVADARLQRVGLERLGVEPPRERPRDQAHDDETLAGRPEIPFRHNHNDGTLPRTSSTRVSTRGLGRSCHSAGPPLRPPAKHISRWRSFACTSPQLISPSPSASHAPGARVAGGRRRRLRPDDAEDVDPCRHRRGRPRCARARQRDVSNVVGQYEEDGAGDEPAERRATHPRA